MVKIVKIKKNFDTGRINFSYAYEESCRHKSFVVGCSVGMT